MATAVALMCTKPMANPAVERGPAKSQDERKNMNPKSVLTKLDNSGKK